MGANLDEKEISIYRSAQITGISYLTVRRHVRQGRLKSHLTDKGRRVIAIKDLKEYWKWARTMPQIISYPLSAMQDNINYYTSGIWPETPKPNE